jgi:hypothetical protein
VKTLSIWLAAALVAISVAPGTLRAQGLPDGGRGGSLPTPKASAPLDLTGYWVSIVTEDWRFRMVTPTKGDYWGVPMNAAARRVAEAWNPKADEAAGDQCKSYGAPAFMRLPAHFRFTWENDQTLKLESDTGMQTRLLRFEAPATPGMRSWQGNSRAQWERPGGRGIGGGGGGAVAPPPRGGWLKVVTTNLRAGYLRKNGVPYSENAVLTEYFDVAPQQNGSPLLVVTTIVEDPTFLTQPFVISSQFKKRADAAGWDPTPCSATW